MSCSNSNHSHAIMNIIKNISDTLNQQYKLYINFF